MPQQMGFLRRRYTKASTDTTTTHYGVEVPDNERWYVATLAFKCSTTDNADVVVWVEMYGTGYVIGSQINMTAGEWYVVTPQMWVEAGERFRFEWDGIVNTEELEVHVTGHIVYTKPCEDE